jgi:CheY-like chemotaxis protein
VIGIYASGEDALARLSNEDVDVVCMDINLGKGIDGIETASQLTSKHAHAIIFISAYADETTLKRAREVAPNAAILGKPVSIDALRRAIDLAGVTNH